MFPRLYAPGEEAEQFFAEQPLSHSFPVGVFSHFGVKVKVESLPRQRNFPELACLLGSGALKVQGEQQNILAPAVLASEILHKISLSEYIGNITNRRKVHGQWAIPVTITTATCLLGSGALKVQGEQRNILAPAVLASEIVHKMPLYELACLLDSGAVTVLGKQQNILAPAMLASEIIH